MHSGSPGPGLEEKHASAACVFEQPKLELGKTTLCARLEASPRRSCALADPLPVSFHGRLRESLPDKHQQQEQRQRADRPLWPHPSVPAPQRRAGGSD